MKTIFVFGRVKIRKIVVAALFGCLIFPSVSQSAPLKTVIHKLIDECLDDPNGPYRLHEENDVVDFKYENPAVLDISKVKKMNGVEYDAMYDISFIHKHKHKHAPNAEWMTGGGQFRVSIKNGILDFKSEYSGLNGVTYFSDSNNNCHYTLDMTAKNAVPQHTTDIAKANKKAKQSEDYSPAPPPKPAVLSESEVIPKLTPQRVASLLAELKQWLYLKTNKDVPYVSITTAQWNELISQDFHEQPSEEISELVRNTADDSLEKLNKGTSYEIYHKQSVDDLLTFSIRHNDIGIATGNILGGAEVWSSRGKAPVAILVTITSGVHKGERALIPAVEYGSNFRLGKRITAS